MGINLKFPLRSYRKGFFEMNNTTIAAVREDIKILLLTKRGERLINSGIGTNISIMAGQLFQPHDRDVLEQEMGAEIRSALAAYMPYVTLRSVNVYSDLDHPAGYNVQRNQALVLMSYGLNTINGMSDSLALTLNNPG